MLGQADTIGVEPMTHAVPTALRLRADQVEPSLPVAVALADAAGGARRCFEVPAIIWRRRRERRARLRRRR
ncbi:MAG: hypothetical protein HS111_17615 [Kofleriaceae bacterium]|nr:hypothetical protein [Kofleriaceae bacterium]